ncbi:hypothetical protein [Deinococcus piscis]|nr:hypothetical protein [Deinococcus piscis]
MTQLMARYYAVNMNEMRHFSDTRTEVGRVRFLLADRCVQLVAEGPGWQHCSQHGSLQEATQLLAFLPQVPQQLYEESLDDLQRRLAVEQAA